MNNNMNISQEGIDLIKSFEGFRSTPYLCPANYVTIGYGQRLFENGVALRGDVGLKRAKKIQPSITRKEAEELLYKNVKRYETCVKRCVVIPLPQACYDALVSFTYNVGCAGFHASTLLRRVNDNDLAGAVEVFAWYNKGGGRILQGLVRRRKAESDLFQRGLL